MIHHITRATRHLIFWSLICIALALLMVRTLLAVADAYKVELAAEISQQVAAPVTIGHLRTHFHRFSPQLILDDITILSPSNNPAIQLKEIRLGINLLHLLLNGDVLAASKITLVGAKLTVKRQADGSIAIVGLKAGEGQPLWLLQGRQYQVLQSTLIWQDEQKKAKPLVFNDVNLMIANKNEHHRVHILMRLDKTQGELFKAVLDIEGDIFHPDTLQGTGFLEGKAINLPAWLTVNLPLDLSIKSGVSDIKVWATWKNAQLDALIGDVQAQTIHLIRPHRADFIAPKLTTRFFWQTQQLLIESFLLENSVKKYPATSLIISGINTPDLTFSSQRMDIQELAYVAEFFTPLANESAKLLVQAQVKGLLENFKLSLNVAHQHWAIESQFTQLSCAPVLNYPGIENLMGSIAGNEQQGKLRLNTQNAQFNYPSIFRHTLPISNLKGELTWQQTADNWTIASPLLTLDFPDLHSKSRFQFVQPKFSKQPLFVDLQLAFSSNDLSKTPNYLPAWVMDKTLLAWLDVAFVKGKASKGELLFYGNVSDFPFLKGQGVFEAGFTAEQVGLNFHPDWPHLVDLAGSVSFEKNRMQVNLTQGKSDKITIQQAEIIIADLQKSEIVQVDGVATATINDTLAFLQVTPLNLPIKAIIEALGVQGNTEASAKLTVPLQPNIVAKVDGAAKFTQASLHIKPLDLPISDVTGTLKFTDKGLSANKINARSLGYPIQIDIGSDDSKTTISGKGHTGIDNLRKQFDLPIWAFAEGSSDYQLQLQLPYADNKPLELDIQTLLSGIALKLPANLAKTSKQQRALALNFKLNNSSLFPLNVLYDNQLKALLNVDAGQHRIQAGHIVLGTGNIGKLPNDGLNIEFNQPQLMLNDWLGMNFSMPHTDNKTPSMATINEISVHSADSFWKKIPLGAFDLRLTPKAQYWLGRLDSAVAKGNLVIPFDLQGQNRIQLDMDELDLTLFKQLSSTQESSQKTPPPKPETMPLITLSSAKTRWQHVDFGRLNLVTERLNNGISFKNVTLNGDLQKLSLSGNWQADDKTRLQGRLEMPLANELFKQLDISNDFSETKGTANFDIYWQGAPQQFSIAALQGSFDIELRDGRILSIEPGLGRILGVLAVAQWIKRLQLDFSDIYEEGLSYNSITGHFDLSQGKARTNNLIVDAIPAKITITGETDLLHHTMNNSIMVAPKSADAIPIAGTIMSKVSSFIGKSLTGKDQDGFFFGSQYQVKGDWGKLQIVPSPENDGLLKKTWNGLTDFSWLNQPKEQ